MMTDEEFDMACAEARRLDSLSGRAVVPGKVLRCADGGDLSDVVEREPDAVFVFPEALHRLPRGLWDEGEQAEQAAALGLRWL